MADFQKAYAVISRHEGGYQNKASDPGNYNSRRELVGTNWGINAQVYERWIGQPPTKVIMAMMPRQEAIQIFNQWYWMPIKGNQIANQNVANILFDAAVNHYVTTAVKMVQRIVKVADDGIMGPITLGAINAGDPATIYNGMKEYRILLYQSIVTRKPEMAEWLPIWMNRINSFQAYGSTGNTTTPQATTSGSTWSGIVIAAITSLLLTRIS